jgi:pimeloyl-ACP methyl ester carboxylesterase
MRRRFSAALVTTLAGALIVPTLSVSAAQSAARDFGRGQGWMYFSADQCDDRYGEGYADDNPGVECAVYDVPLYYFQPRGEHTSIAVTKLNAFDQENKAGTVVLNFGGPGDPGADSLALYASFEFLEPLRERFDVVSFNPRGTGFDTPLQCLSAEESAALDPDPEAFPADRDKALAFAEALVDACLTRSPLNLVSSLTTDNAARDMDLLRVGMGEEQLTFLGYSYGTQLGATYAALFPERVRALVLDGATNPDSYINNPLEDDFDQNAAFEVALERFFAWCDGPGAEYCAFVGPGMDARGAFLDVIERREAEPAEIEGTTVDGASMLSLTSSLLYARPAWPILAEALTVAGSVGVGGGDESPDVMAAASAPASAAVRLALRKSAEDEQTFDTFFDAFVIWVNTERRYERDVASIDASRERFVEDAPIFGADYWTSEYASALWPTEGIFRFTGPWSYSGRTPLLVIGTTYDPATPYSGAVAMTEQLGNAVLLTMEGDGHTASFGSNGACIDDAVLDYLADLTVPADGTVCEQETNDPPVGGGDTGATAAEVLARAFMSRVPG